MNYALRHIGCFLWIFCPWWLCAQLTEPFYLERFSEGWRDLAGLTFDERGYLYAWEKMGRVHIWDPQGERLPEPLLDLQQEVGDWRDHGLLGFTLDPNFLENGYVYALFAVDPHHLKYAGTGSYDPALSESFRPSIGRLVRYTADAASGYTRVLPASRKVLLGATAADGIPLLHESHGVGALAFGADGTLLLSAGDGASYAGADGGGNDLGAYASQALAEGILRPKEDIGAFRAQLIDNLNGKVLRIDPSTGQGLPSNPFFDPAAPAAPRSRVWALGLRNPFRFAVRPETGSHYPGDGDPGALFVGDVGWAYWEELNVVTAPGQNFGWPLYEGMKDRWQFNRYSLPVANLDAAVLNPACAITHYLFQDLLADAGQRPEVSLMDPCDPSQPLPLAAPTFVHKRPTLTWSNEKWNDEDSSAYVSTFDEDDRGLIRLGSPEATVMGETFTGFCSLGGVFYTGESFPEAYHGKFFLTDFKGWIRVLEVDDKQQLRSVEPFYAGNGDHIVDMAVNPVDGCLYLISRKPEADASAMERICFGGNPKPRAVLRADRQYGPSPLTVQFTAAESVDPEGEALSYFWSFGDGAVAEGIAPSHRFEAVGDQPVAYTVNLTVRDARGAEDRRQLQVSLNNTPPMVHITSLEDSSYYGTSEPYWQHLEAKVVDVEHSPGDLQYTWQTFLHHNTHSHAEAADLRPETQTYITPVGCGEETYYYRVLLTVKDAAGLTGTDEVRVFPDCGPPPGTFSHFELREHAQKVRLDWTVEEDTAAAFYEIYRAIDSAEVEVLDTVWAQRVVGLPQAYSFIDAQPHLGRNRYQLKLYNRFRSVVYSAEQEIWVHPAEAIAQLYPTLHQGTVYLQFFVHATTPVGIKIWDLSGREVYAHAWQQTDAAPVPVDLKALSQGVYYYQLVVGNKAIRGKMMRME